VRLQGGKVLVAGGLLPGDSSTAITSFYDPTSNTWTATGSLSTARSYPCVVALSDGRVLAAGGFTHGITTVTNTAEIYDLTTGRWSATGSLAVARQSPGCVLLSDGKVLLAGGADDADTDLASAELYDPAAGSWTTLPAMSVGRHNPRAALLPNGDALFVGAHRAERFIATTRTWTPFPEEVPTGDLIVLPTGKVLAVGLTVGSSNAAIFDSAAGTWRSVAKMSVDRLGVASALLPTGQVLVTGGVNGSGTALSTAELFDISTEKWAAVEPMVGVRVAHSATVLTDGRVLVVGAGDTRSVAAQVFNGLVGAKCASGSTCGTGICSDGRCCDRGCDGACEACDVAGKEGTCSPVAGGAPRKGHATCAPYASCSAGACTASCTGDSECTSGNICYPAYGRCGPEHGICSDNLVTDPKSGATRDCGSFACSPAGDCLTACSVSADCAAGHLCDGAGTCVPLSAPAAAISGGCTTGGQTGAGSGLLLVGGLLVLAGLRRRRLFAVGLGAIAISGLGCDPTTDRNALGAAVQPVTWTTAGTMKTPLRVFHSASVLQDGRVLVCGGASAGTLSSCEAFDPKTRTWALAGAMKKARYGHLAVVLSDGRVLVSGGNDGTNRLFSAEVFDPTTNVWSQLPSMSGVREAHVGGVLKDGTVIVAGGIDTSSKPLSSAEVFDPATSTWTSTPTMPSTHAFGMGAALKDGRFLVAGGNAVSYLSAADVYDPAARSWTKAPMGHPHGDGVAVVLASGEVLVAGGDDGTSELFDPAKNVWSDVGSTSVQRITSAATLLGDGRVILVGGRAEAPAMIHQSVEVFDPAKKTWGSFEAMGAPRSGHTATTLQTGEVLLVGGNASLAISDGLVAPPEILNLSTGDACTTNVQCATGFCVDGRCCNTACTGACNACDARGSEGTCSPISGKPRGGDHKSCAPYDQCNAGACATVCGSDDACDDDHACDVATASCVEPKATCDGDHTVTDGVTGQAKDCGPFRCRRNGTCIAKCSTSDDCAAGAICDGNVCRVPAATPESGGCAVGSAGLNARALSSAGLLLVLGLGARRLRRRRAA
jgi:MYXO-CTERM domain-containing protein